MTTRAPQNLDAEELLHLALQAIKQDRTADAIGLLERGVAQNPQSGPLHHMLGAMYAQAGMIDRGIGEMTQAIRYAPQLHMARFQLGLLHFTSTDVASADRVWQPLGDLPSEHPLHIFRSALLHLAGDEFAPCIEELKRGIERNTEYPSLNRDMRLVAEKAEQALAESAAQAAQPGAPSTRHVLLSGYEESTGEKTKD